MDAKKVPEMPRVKKETKNKIRIEMEDRTPFWTRMRKKIFSAYFLQNVLWYIFRLILMIGVCFVILRTEIFRNELQHRKLQPLCRILHRNRLRKPAYIIGRIRRTVCSASLPGCLVQLYISGSCRYSESLVSTSFLTMFRAENKRCFTVVSLMASFIAISLTFNPSI